MIDDHKSIEHHSIDAIKISMSASKTTEHRSNISSSDTGRRERNRAAKRARILAAARELFSEHGFDGATARDISRRAGVATGTLFLYVNDKRELLFEILAEDAEGLFRLGSRAADGARTLPDAIMSLFGPFFDYYARQPALARSILEELFLRPHEPDRMGIFSREHASHVARLVGAAKERGEVRSDVSVAAATRACFAHYAFWIQAWLGSNQVNRVQFETRLHEALVLQLRGAGLPPAIQSEV